MFNTRIFDFFNSDDKKEKSALYDGKKDTPQHINNALNNFLQKTFCKEYDCLT